MHIYFDKNSSSYGLMLRKLLQQMEESDELFADIRDTMIQMRSGDGSADAHYSVVKTRFGFSTDADARAAFEELDSAYSKTSGDGQVSNVRAARNQLFAKLRGW